MPTGLLAAVIEALRGEIASGVLPATLPDARRARVESLLSQVGSPTFYELVARHEPTESPEWTSMGRVQRQFAAAEPRFDPRTRAYSESMRLTLHAALLDCVARPRHREGQSLYQRFIELHTSAFRQNGGWFDNLRIPLGGAVKVLRATPLRMLLETPRMLLGAVFTDSAAVRGALWVRTARRRVLPALAT